MKGNDPKILSLELRRGCASAWSSSILRVSISATLITMISWGSAPSAVVNEIVDPAAIVSGSPPNA